MIKNDCLKILVFLGLMFSPVIAGSCIMLLCWIEKKFDLDFGGGQE